MNREMKIIREVSDQAEKFYPEAVRLGDHAAQALKAPHRSQLTSLESIAESTFKTSDVFDYIKKQIARHDYWRKLSEQKENNLGFGERLKQYLETNLRNSLVTICRRLENQDATDEEKQERRRIYLLLMRQFIRQLTIEYEYQISRKKES